MKKGCIVEDIGLKIGNTIFLLAGTKESICKGCELECPYQLRDYTKQDYETALKEAES